MAWLFGAGLCISETEDVWGCLYTALSGYREWYKKNLQNSFSKE